MPKYKGKEKNHMMKTEKTIIHSVPNHYVTKEL